MLEFLNHSQCKFLHLRQALTPRRNFNQSLLSDDDFDLVQTENHSKRAQSLFDYQSPSLKYKTNQLPSEIFNPRISNHTENMQGYRRTILELEEIDEDEIHFYIHDRDTGLLIDTRIEEELEFVTQTNVKITSDVKPWTQYWKQSKAMINELIDCVQTGDKEGVEEILKHKAEVYVDINIRDIDQMTPLHFACESKHTEIAKLLIYHGCEIDLLTSFRRTPLHLTVINSNLDLVHELLHHGANPNSQDLDGQTPLHYATIKETKQIIEILIRYKADPMIRNKFNQNSFDVAPSITIIQLFEKLGKHRQNIDHNDYEKRINLNGSLIFQKNSRVDHVRSIIEKSRQLQNQNNQDLSFSEVKRFKGRTKRKWERFLIQQTSNRIINHKLSQKLTPDDFIFHKILGKGAFGEVYLVQNKSNHQFYAMKVIKKQVAMESNNLQRFSQERDILASINHPYIVKLFYAFQTSKNLFLGMEFCSSGDMSELLDDYGYLSEDESKIFVGQILLALETLHSRGIVYRDLKPQNVVIDSEGNAKLTDFGLGKKCLPNRKLTSFCGTAAYLAPEMIQKRGHDASIDWYLLGVFMYELLVGLPPYFDNDKEIMFENIKRGPLKLPRTLSKQAKDLILKLLVRDPAQRLGSLKDGEEIRQHAWFSDIDWVQLYKNKHKKFFIPKEMKSPQNKLLKLKFLQDSTGGLEVPGWSFQDEDCDVLTK